MAKKIVDTLIILAGPIIMALSQVWSILLPVGFEEAIVGFLNVLSIILGGTIAVFKGVPALVRLAPQKLVDAIRNL